MATKFLTAAVFATVALTAAVFTSCDKDDPTPVPVITIETQPVASTTLTEGNIADTLTIKAVVTQGATLTYQWSGNTTSSDAVYTTMGGATSASYVISTDLTEGTYYYLCEVGATGAVAVRSQPAVVIVEPAEGE